MDLTDKILVIDDDPDILGALTFLLEDAGYSVVSSERGDSAEALEENDKSLPRVIILDALLSGKDGRDITKKLRKNQKTKHLPIIMISAHPGAEESAKQAGADAFLAKPFDIDVLLNKVSYYFNQDTIS